MIRAFVGTLTLAGIAAWQFSPDATGATSPALVIDPVAATVPDPLDFPPVNRPVASEAAPAWVLDAPASSTQTEKSANERGVNPCLTPDPGFGNYHGWDRSPSVGQMIVPKDLELGERGEFPVVVHFHGHDAARKEWVNAIDDAVLVGIDLGINSGPYLQKFGERREIEALFDSVEKGVAERLGVERARIGKLGLSSWSAGYGAVERILRSKLAERVDTVILLDGLHTGRADTQRARQALTPFVDFAQLAAEGERLMVVSHSSIVPPGYASTTETASYLVWQLGGEPEASTGEGEPMGLEMIRRYDHGHFHMLGYAGNGKLDHCAHLGLYEQVLTTWLAPRWGLKRASD